MIGALPDANGERKGSQQTIKQLSLSNHWLKLNQVDLKRQGSVPKQ